jgi:hypothetical protein
MMDDITGWLVPFLLALGVVCAGISLLGPLRRGWAVAAIVFGAVTALLVLISTAAAP